MKNQISKMIDMVKEYRLPVKVPQLDDGVPVEALVDEFHPYWDSEESINLYDELVALLTNYAPGRAFLTMREGSNEEPMPVYVAESRKLTEVQRKALNKSILHWNENVEIEEDDHDPENIDVSAESCACCDIGNPLIEEGLPARSSCKGCPIYEYTGQPFCRGTPYQALLAVQGKPGNFTTAREMQAWLVNLRDGNNPRIYPVPYSKY